MRRMTWLNTTPDAEKQARRVDAAVTQSEQHEADLVSLNSETRDTLTAMRLWLHLDGPSGAT